MSARGRYCSWSCSMRMRLFIYPIGAVTLTGALARRGSSRSWSPHGADRAALSSAKSRSVDATVLSTHLIPRMIKSLPWQFVSAKGVVAGLKIGGNALLRNARFVARFEKKLRRIRGARWTLNQRVPGSSPGAPTNVLKRLASDNRFIPTSRQRLIPTNRLLLFRWPPHPATAAPRRWCWRTA
jgi:hypothetical protein